jgi:hypothetical protein
MIAEEADRAGLDLALCYAVAEGESAGRRVFGNDWGTRGVDRVPYAHLPVSKLRVDALIAHTRRGGVSNGVSIFQATYAPLLYEADKLPGGASVSRNTARVCLELLAGHLRSSGYRTSLSKYNGGYTPNYAYADGIIRLHNQWKTRLS